MIFPPFLHSNDLVAITSPSGFIESGIVYKAKELLEQWDLQVTLGQFTLAKYGRFAGKKEDRLKDLQEMLDNPDIKAIFCSRGGYGAIQLLDHHLQFDRFCAYPKWIVGYSDITVLHSTIQRLNIASIHAPMCKHLAEEGEDTSTLFLKHILFGSLPLYNITGHPLNRNGNCSGTLRGGNLSVLNGLRGTSYDFPAPNTILFIEDIGEKPYHIERMLYNFRLGGLLENLSGLIIGQFTNYEDDPGMMASLEHIIFNLVADYRYPVCFGFPTGHVQDNFPMICGAEVELHISDNNVSLHYLTHP